MTKAVRFSASILLPYAATGRSAGDRSERDVLATVALFSATGLLMSVVAIQFGLDPVWF
jgi:hypothetical protein